MKDAIDPLRSIDSWSCETCEVIGGRPDAGFVLLCDHAGNEFPSEYGSLGLPASELERHIAYDIGARAVVEGLARVMGVPAILSRYSRLLIDLNRGTDDPTLIMRLSDGAVVPGNRQLTDAERETRIDRFWRPYHGAVDGVIDRCIAAGVPPALVSIHSFTEAWKQCPRPWHAGVLWDQDDRLPSVLLAALRGESGLVVGDNQPYSGKLIGDCMWQHGTERGLANAIIEIRQDLIGTEAGQSEWVERLARILVSIFSDRAVRTRLNRIAHDKSQPPLTLRRSA